METTQQQPSPRQSFAGLGLRLLLVLVLSAGSVVAIGVWRKCAEKAGASAYRAPGASRRFRKGISAGGQNRRRSETSASCARKAGGNCRSNKAARGTRNTGAYG